MRRVTTSLAFVFSALVTTGCMESENDNDGDSLDSGMPDGGALDSSAIKVVDATTNTPDSAWSCHSWTMPTATMCGGPHCLQTPAQMAASVQPGAACAGENNLQGLCSLRASDVVGECSFANVTDRRKIQPCAEKALGDSVTPACLQCYLRSGDCAFNNCLGECINGTENERCDTCRLNKGCATVFYDCAGLTPPPR